MSTRDNIRLIARTPISDLSIRVSSSGVYRPLQVNVLICNCKQIILSLPLLVYTTVACKMTQKTSMYALQQYRHYNDTQKYTIE